MPLRQGINRSLTNDCELRETPPEAFPMDSGISPLQLIVGLVGMVSYIGFLMFLLVRIAGT